MIITIDDLAAEKIREIQKENNEEHLSVRIRIMPG